MADTPGQPDWFGDERLPRHHGVPGKDIAAGACMGDGVLFDICDRTPPKVITTVSGTP